MVRCRRSGRRHAALLLSKGQPEGQFFISSIVRPKEPIQIRSPVSAFIDSKLLDHELGFEIDGAFGARLLASRVRSVNKFSDTGLLSLTATQAGTAIREGRVDQQRYARAALQRIADRDRDLKAWAFLDLDLALRRAAELDSAPNAGPLHQNPGRIKDVIDTFDMPTCHNSPLFVGNRPASDASCVAILAPRALLFWAKRRRPSSPRPDAIHAPGILTTWNARPADHQLARRLP